MGAVATHQAIEIDPETLAACESAEQMAMEAGEALEKAEKIAQEAHAQKAKKPASKKQQRVCVIEIPRRRDTLERNRNLRNRIHMAREALLEQKEAEAKLAILFCWLLGMLCMMVVYWAVF